MKELFYFASLDLLARVEYRQADNSLRYATHRNIAVQEQIMVEQYLLATFARKTEYHRRQPAFFVYLGKEARLTKILDKFRSQNAEAEPSESEKIVDDSVSDLISQSMQNYYFEQIGETLLEARREKSAFRGGAKERRGQRKAKLEQLVKAYNAYADQEVAIDEIIPAELKPCFGLPAETEYSRKDLAVR